MLLCAVACDPAEQLPNSDELEAQLRDDPDRAGRVGQLVGIAVSQHAHRRASAIAVRADPRCTSSPQPNERWVAELTLERRRGASIRASWIETRTLDHGANAVSMRYAARYRTEIETDGARAAEWRVTPNGTFVATQTDAGDRWYRRPTEDDETQRIMDYADGMLQSLLDAAGGWQDADDGWTLGDTPLRCGRAEPHAAFVARLRAGATATQGVFTVDGRTRHLEATWMLSDGSTMVASYADRVVALPEPIADPPAELMVPIARDRSLYRAQQLLSRLAEDRLATVASAPAATTSPTAPAASGDDDKAQSK